VTPANEQWTRGNDKPLFSVIIPTYARLASLEACLNGFCRSKFPRDRFEIIVVDDGSPVCPNHVAERFQDKLNITILSQPNAGPAVARNFGARHARGVYVAFIDDDCVPAPDWLSALSQQFSLSPDCLAGGSIINSLPDNPYSTTTQLIQAYVYEYHYRRPDTSFLLNGSNMALSTSHFQKLGGFSNSFRQAGGEDYDFCHRWHAAGRPVSYVPKATVYHAHELTFSSFWRQHFTYGRGLLVCRTRMGSRSGQRLELEAFSFYVGLFLFPLSRSDSLYRWVYLALVGLSQVATLTGAFAEAVATTIRRKGSDSSDRDT